MKDTSETPETQSSQFFEGPDFNPHYCITMSVIDINEFMAGLGPRHAPSEFAARLKITPRDENQLRRLIELYGTARITHYNGLTKDAPVHFKAVTEAMNAIMAWVQAHVVPSEGDAS